MATFEATIDKAVAWLQWQPLGAATDDVAGALGLSYTHVGGALGLAVERRLIGWVHAPEGKAHNRRLYFALKHLPKVHGLDSMRSAPARPGVGVARSIAAWPKRQRGEPVKEAVTTVCPAGKDHRFTVQPEEVESRFRAMGPGRYDPDSRAWPVHMLEAV